MPKFNIPITTKTLTVYQLEGKNTMEVLTQLGVILAGHDNTRPVLQREMSRSIGKPTQPVNDDGHGVARVAVVDADVQHAEDHQNDDEHKDGDDPTLDVHVDDSTLPQAALDATPSKRR